MYFYYLRTTIIYIPLESDLPVLIGHNECKGLHLPTNNKFCMLDLQCMKIPISCFPGKVKINTGKCYMFIAARCCSLRLSNI